jgi:hypothetical protein
MTRAHHTGAPDSHARRRARIAAWVLASAAVAAAAAYGISSAVGGPSRPAATGVPTCTLAGLHVSEYGGAATAGTALVLLRVVDATGQRCELRGTPSLRALTGAPGSHHPVAVGTAGGMSLLDLPPPKPVLLGRSAPAGVLVASADVPVNGQPTCARMTAIELSLRASAGSTLVALQAPVDLCGKPAFDVSSFYPFDTLRPEVRPFG